MNTIYNIAVFTARDQMKRKSFYLLLAVAIMFILTIRGCYRADYTVNSQQVDRSTIASSSRPRRTEIPSSTIQDTQ